MLKYPTITYAEFPGYGLLPLIWYPAPDGAKALGRPSRYTWEHTSEDRDTTKPSCCDPVPRIQRVTVRGQSGYDGLCDPHGSEADYLNGPQPSAPTPYRCCKGWLDGDMPLAPQHGLLMVQEVIPFCCGDLTVGLLKSSPDPGCNLDLLLLHEADFPGYFRKQLTARDWSSLMQFGKVYCRQASHLVWRHTAPAGSQEIVGWFAIAQGRLLFWKRVDSGQEVAISFKLPLALEVNLLFAQGCTNYEPRFFNPWYCR